MINNTSWHVVTPLTSLIQKSIDVFTIASWPWCLVFSCLLCHCKGSCKCYSFKRNDTISKRNMLFRTNAQPHRPQINITNQHVVLVTIVFRHPFCNLHEHGLQIGVDGMNEVIQFIGGIMSCKKKTLIVRDQTIYCISSVSSY